MAQWSWGKCKSLLDCLESILATHVVHAFDESAGFSGITRRIMQRSQTCKTLTVRINNIQQCKPGLMGISHSHVLSHRHQDEYFEPLVSSCDQQQSGFVCLVGQFWGHNGDWELRMSKEGLIHKIQEGYCCEAVLIAEASKLVSSARATESLAIARTDRFTLILLHLKSIWHSVRRLPRWRPYSCCRWCSVPTYSHLISPLLLHTKMPYSTSAFCLSVVGPRWHILFVQLYLSITHSDHTHPFCQFCIQGHWPH